MLSSVFISQTISVYMEMLQRRAHQRRRHVFSTAGGSEVLLTNFVPEDLQRGLCQCVCLCAVFVRAAMCLCVLVFVFHAYA